MTQSEWECKEKARRSGMRLLLIEESQARDLAIALTYDYAATTGRSRQPPSCTAIVWGRHWLADNDLLRWGVDAERGRERIRVKGAVKVTAG
jgi:hypothetical protein